MNFDDYLRTIYQRYIDFFYGKEDTHDKVISLAQFKHDLFYPLLEKLEIISQVKSHFKGKSELNEKELRFLNFISELITTPININEINQPVQQRSLGKGKNCTKGRAIINNILNPFYEDLLNIYDAFAIAISDSKNNKHNIEINSIYQECFINVKKGKIEKEISTLIDNLFGLKYAYISCIIKNLEPEYQKIKNSLDTIINGYKGYNKTTFLSIDENNIKNEIPNLLAQILPLTEGEKEKIMELKKIQKKPKYRTNMSKEKKISQELYSMRKQTIQDSTDVDISDISIDPEKVNYLKTSGEITVAQDIYSAICRNIPNIEIDFHKEQKSL